MTVLWYHSCEWNPSWLFLTKLCFVGNRSCDIGVGASRQNLFGNGVPQGTPNQRWYDQASSIYPLITKIVLPQYWTPKWWAHIFGLPEGQPLEMVGLEARYYLMGLFKFGLGKMGPLLCAIQIILFVVARLISRLSCSGCEKLMIVNIYLLLSLIICLVYLISKQPSFIKLD